MRHSVHHHHGGGHHHHHGPPPPPPPPHQFESSEDTSDTCLDDHGAGDARRVSFIPDWHRLQLAIVNYKGGGKCCDLGHFCQVKLQFPFILFPLRSPFFLRSSNRRATGKRPKSGFWSRGKNSSKEDSSVARDSGIAEDNKMMSKCGCGHAESPEDNDSTWYSKNLKLRQNHLLCHFNPCHATESHTMSDIYCT